MSVVLEKTRNMRKHLPSTPTGRREVVSLSAWRASRLDHGARASLRQTLDRIWQVNPTISEFLSIENIQRLEDAREQGDSCQSILIE